MPAHGELQAENGNADGEGHGEAGNHRPRHHIGQRQEQDEEAEALIAERNQKIGNGEVVAAMLLREPPQRGGDAAWKSVLQ